MKNKHLLFGMAALLLLFVTGASAAVSDGDICVLQNVETGYYVGGGNDYGTRASLLAKPQQWTVNAGTTAGTYTLTSYQYNGSAHSLSLNDTAAKGGALYTDEGADDGVLEWIIAETTDGHCTLSFLEDGVTYYLTGVAAGDPVTYGTDGTAKLAQFDVISQSDITAAQAALSPEKSMDVTPLIMNPTFNAKSNATDVYWTFTGYNGTDAISGNYSVCSTTNINVAESWHSGTGFKCSQTLKSLPAGTYTFTIHGFYNQDAGTGLTDDNRSYVFAGSSTAVLPEKYSENGAVVNGAANVTNAYTDFLAGLYEVSVVYEVKKAGEDVEIGVAGPEHSDMWTVWGEMSLTYTAPESPLKDGGVYLLKNVETERYVAGGNLSGWGTQASLLNTPQQFTANAMAAENVFTLASYQYNGDNHFLGVNSANELYCDSGAKEWTIKLSSDALHYTLACDIDVEEQEVDENGNLVYVTDSNGDQVYDSNGDVIPVMITKTYTKYLTGVDVGVLSSSNADESLLVLGNDPDDPLALFDLVREADIHDMQDEAGIGIPVDVTGLIQNPSLNYSSNSVDKYWDVRVFDDSEKAPQNSAFASRDEDYGTWSTSVVESYHSTNGFNIHQTLANLKAGSYVFKAHAFYRADGTPDKDLPVIYAGDNTVVLPAESTEPSSASYTSAGSMQTAYADFLDGLYPVEVKFVVENDGEDVTIGFKGECTNLWNIFGELSLDYYAPQPSDDEYVAGDIATVESVTGVDGKAVQVPVASNNLVQNCGFNTLTLEGWKVGGETMYTQDPTEETYKAPTTITEWGGYNNAAYITTNGAGTSSEHTLMQSIAVEEGKTYLFICYTKGQTPSSNNIQYNALFEMTDATNEVSVKEDDGSTHSKVITEFNWGASAGNTSTDWTRTEYVFKATTPYVGIRLGWNTNACFDAFQLYELDVNNDDEYSDGDTVTLPNGDFTVVGGNLVQNGGFIDDVLDWQCGTEAGGYTGIASVDSVKIHLIGGYNGGEYIATNGMSIYAGRTLMQAVNIEAGKSYLFVCYTSGTTPQAKNYAYNALFKMTGATTEDGWLAEFDWGAAAETKADSWTRTEYAFTATTDYVGIRLGWNEGAYFDGIQLYEIESADATLPLEDGMYLLQNATTGLYLGGANESGRQPSMLATPQQFTLTGNLPENAYAMTSYQHQSEHQNYLGTGLISDNLGTGLITDAERLEWTITDLGDGTYSIYNEKVGGYLNGTAAKYGLATVSADADAWNLVSVADLAEAHAAYNFPVDVTGLIMNPTLNPESASDYSPAYWTTSAVSGSATATAETNIGFVASGNTSHTANAVEAYRQTNGFDFSQTLTLKAGAYKLSAQGFYRNDVVSGNSVADGLPVLYAGDESSELPSYDTANGSIANLATSAQNMHYAYEDFQNGLYPVELTFVVDEDDTDVTIGMTGDNSNVWAVLGELNLMYYGVGYEYLIHSCDAVEGELVPYFSNTERYYPAHWTCDSLEALNLHVNTWSTENDDSGMKTPFCQYWVTGTTLDDVTINHKQLNGLVPGDYTVSIDARIFSETGEAISGSVIFTANGVSEDLIADGTDGIYNNGLNDETEVYGTYTLHTTVGDEGLLDISLTVSDANFNWLAWKNLVVIGPALPVLSAVDSKMNTVVGAEQYTALQAYEANKTQDTYNTAVEKIDAAQISADYYARIANVADALDEAGTSVWIASEAGKAYMGGTLNNGDWIGEDLSAAVKAQTTNGADMSYVLEHDIVTWDAQQGNGTSTSNFNIFRTIHETYNGTQDADPDHYGAFAEGDIFSCTVKGLQPGTYEISFYAQSNACNGVTDVAGDDIAQVYANDTIAAMTVGTDNVCEYTDDDLFTFWVYVEDTDEDGFGELTFGVRNIGVGGNWVTLHGVGLTLIALGDDVTAVNGVSADALMDENAPIYNLQGMRVSKATKGIYIQNGKKFIVK
ncbi:MAG: hypothetical protein LUC86_06245 [Prevotellaceae bacterium]|nr:hypothetical protein [Prevotellaceae bacterium]